MAAPGDTDAYRAAIGHFATGVTIVTSSVGGRPAGLTTNAVCSLSLEPLLLLVCLDRGSRTLAAVQESRRLAVNVLASHQEELAVTFAGKAPHTEKFQDVAYRDSGGAPVLEGVVAWLAGGVEHFLPGGDHVIAIVAVEDFGAPGGEPLLFHRGVYRSLGG